MKISNNDFVCWCTDMTGLEWCYIVAMFCILFIGIMVMNVIIAIDLASWITDKIIHKLEEMEENNEIDF